MTQVQYKRPWWGASFCNSNLNCLSNICFKLSNSTYLLFRVKARVMKLMKWPIATKNISPSTIHTWSQRRVANLVSPMMSSEHWQTNYWQGPNVAISSQFGYQISRSDREANGALAILPLVPVGRFVAAVPVVARSLSRSFVPRSLAPLSVAHSLPPLARSACACCATCSGGFCGCYATCSCGSFPVSIICSSIFDTTVHGSLFASRSCLFYLSLYLLWDLRHFRLNRLLYD